METDRKDVEESEGEVVMKLNWSTIVQSVLGVLLTAAIIALFHMHSDIVTMRTQLDERQKAVVGVERIGKIEGDIKALQSTTEAQGEDLEHLRTWLQRVSERTR